MRDEVPLLYASEPPSVQLMNTVWADKNGVHDALASMAGYRAWARLSGLPGQGRLSAGDLAQARSLRDALRRLTAAAVKDDRPAAVDLSLPVPDALHTVNSFNSSHRATLRDVGSDDFELEWRPSGTVFERSLAALALEGAELIGRSGGREVKACGGPGCVLYFVRDGGRRGWCSSGCGNRARVARHYQRHRLGADAR